MKKEEKTTEESKAQSLNKRLPRKKKKLGKSGKIGGLRKDNAV